MIYLKWLHRALLGQAVKPTKNSNQLPCGFFFKKRSGRSSQNRQMPAKVAPGNER